MVSGSSTCSTGPVRSPQSATSRPSGSNASVAHSFRPYHDVVTSGSFRAVPDPGRLSVAQASSCIVLLPFAARPGCCGTLERDRLRLDRVAVVRRRDEQPAAGRDRQPPVRQQHHDRGGRDHHGREPAEQPAVRPHPASGGRHRSATRSTARIHGPMRQPSRDQQRQRDDESHVAQHAARAAFRGRRRDGAAHPRHHARGGGQHHDRNAMIAPCRWPTRSRHPGSRRSSGGHVLRADQALAAAGVDIDWDHAPRPVDVAAGAAQALADGSTEGLPQPTHAAEPRNVGAETAAADQTHMSQARPLLRRSADPTRARSQWSPDSAPVRPPRPRIPAPNPRHPRCAQRLRVSASRALEAPNARRASSSGPRRCPPERTDRGSSRTRRTTSRTPEHRCVPSRVRVEAVVVPVLRVDRSLASPATALIPTKFTPRLGRQGHTISDHRSVPLPCRQEVERRCIGGPIARH